MFAKETNIGQHVMGNVNATTLVLNIGGQPVALSEIDSGQLEKLRGNLSTALKRRAQFSKLPNWIGAGLMLGLLTQMPAALSQSYSASGMSPILNTSLMVLASALSVWFVIRLQFGNWQHHQKRVAADLQARLAMIDAELDTREAASAPGPAGWFRALYRSLQK